MQSRGIYYAARDAKTSLAKAYQATRRIDRVFQSPRLVVFETPASLKLLDLTGDFARRMGASMHGGQHAIALNERALREPFFPAHPLFHRSLSDDILLDPLKHAASALGYALR